MRRIDYESWEHDPMARYLFHQVYDFMMKLCTWMCPNYELTNMGINRDFNTEEIRIVLHLRSKDREDHRGIPTVADATSFPRKLR